MRATAAFLLALAAALVAPASQRGLTPATRWSDPGPALRSFSAGEADPPPHRPRHAASPSSPPDGRRSAFGAGGSPRILRATRRNRAVVVRPSGDAVEREERVRELARDPAANARAISEALASADWTERFDALDALGRALRVPRELAREAAEHLRDAHPNVRAEALVALRAAGVELEDVALESALRDPFAGVRLELARSCVGARGAAARALLALCDDADARVAREAEALLFARGPEDLDAKLARWDAARLVERPDDFLDALAAIERAGGDAHFVGAVRARLARQDSLAARAAWEALAYLVLGAGDAETLVAGWFALLGEPGSRADQRQRAWLASAASAGDSALVGALLDAIEALDALALIGPKEARGTPAARALADRWPDYASWAFRPGIAERMERELARAAAEASIGREALLLARAESFAPEIAAELWERLLGRRDAWAEDVLARWFAPDRPRAVRLAAARTVADTLARTGDAASGDALARALGDPDEELRRHAFDALCDAPDPSPWLAAMHGWWRGLAERGARLEALRELSRAVAPTPFRADLIELWDSGAGRTASVLELLALFAGDHEVEGDVERWIEGELARLEGEAAPPEDVTDGPWREAEQRAKALVTALERIAGGGAADSIEAVLARADGRSDELAKACAAALAKSAEGRARLVGWLRPSASGTARVEAALGLVEERGSEALEVIVERYASSDEETRVRMLRACGRIGDGRALEWLASVARAEGSSPAERVVALEALGNGVHGAAAARVLCDVVDGARDPDLERGAMAALRELGEREALGCVRAALADPTRAELARDEALPALAQLAPEEVGAELLKAPREKAREELCARFAGERLAAREFAYRGELAAAGRLAARSELAEALSACGAWWCVDGRLLVELAREADEAGDRASARELVDAGCAALAGEAGGDEWEAQRCGARALSLRFALEARDWGVAERGAREIERAWWTGRTSERALSEALGRSDPRAGLDAVAWLAATAEQAAAYAALARGDREEARERVQRAAERVGRSERAQVQQGSLEARVR